MNRITIALALALAVAAALSACATTHQAVVSNGGTWEISQVDCFENGSCRVSVRPEGADTSISNWVSFTREEMKELQAYLDADKPDELVGKKLAYRELDAKSAGEVLLDLKRMAHEYYYRAQPHSTPMDADAAKYPHVWQIRQVQCFKTGYCILYAAPELVNEGAGGSGGIDATRMAALCRYFGVAASSELYGQRFRSASNNMEDAQTEVERLIEEAMRQ